MALWHHLRSGTEDTKASSVILHLRLDGFQVHLAQSLTEGLPARWENPTTPGKQTLLDGRLFRCTDHYLRQDRREILLKGIKGNITLNRMASIGNSASFRVNWRQNNLPTVIMETYTCNTVRSCIREYFKKQSWFWVFFIYDLSLFTWSSEHENWMSSSIKSIRNHSASIDKRLMSFDWRYLTKIVENSAHSQVLCETV